MSFFKRLFSFKQQCGIIWACRNGIYTFFTGIGSLPNCETRKWTVLGETRVGVFAKVGISTGTELSCNYDFEWYGGATVNSLCGAPNCCLFLGADSQCFQVILLLYVFE